MAIPDVKTTILDGALGLAAPSSARTHVKLGTCSAGTANALEAVSDISTLKAKFGQGPLVEAAARALAIAGGPVLCMKVTGSAPGAVGAPVATKTGTATLAISGAAFDAYDIVIEILKGGATLIAGTATFRYSLDGGKTFSAELAAPTSGIYAIPDSNVTLTWTYSTGTAFVASDKWTAAATAPGYSTSDLATAFAALLADPRTWFMVHVVGPAADLAGARGVFAALATHMASAAASYRYARALMEAPAGTDAAIIANTTGFGDLGDVRVSVAGGFLSAISPISGRSYKRSVAWETAARLSAVAPSQDVGAVEDGALSGVVSLDRDERSTPALDDARFTSARTHIGRQGYYLTRGRVMAPAGSDFGLWTNCRVMDIASATARDRALRFLNAKVPVNADGTIQEKSAKAIESYIAAGLRSELVDKSDATDVSVEVDRTVNILSSGSLKIRVRVTPYGYASSIEVELGFTSPALAAAA
jgi:hypothetical protein